MESERTHRTIRIAYRILILISAILVIVAIGSIYFFGDSAAVQPEIKATVE